ncbi:ATP-binding protein [Roseibium sp.]|uniref:ATP-binding protein n=1 Tax=Roseibium sp. TaxID=1936156 RepID=UPI0032989A6F
MTKKSAAVLIFDCAIFVGAAGGTYLAQTLDRPITAVLTFLTGVIVIAVHSGLLRALVAAVSASLVYNFFLSEPAYQFGVTTAEEAVPLLAFNTTALVAGIMVGRLRDSANRAYHAQSETSFLLTVSDRLQQAIKVVDVEIAIRNILPTQGVTSVEIYLRSNNVYIRPSTGTVGIDLMSPLVDSGEIPGSQKSIIVELEGARGSLGIVKFRLAQDHADHRNIPNLQSVSALLALAIERCLLLEEVAEAEVSARSETLKDAILSSVSHDIRTPLTVIEAAASALASTEISLSEDDQKSLLASIIDQCRRLDRYTSELLDVGRIHAGISNDDLEAVDLVEVAQLAIRHVKKTRPSSQFDRQLPRHPVLVTANAAMLEQALFNIIDNAQKFGGEEGPVQVALETDGQKATISISDRGRGIQFEDKEQIFRRFKKTQQSSNANGMGLGLFIAKGFIEAFSGTIDVASPLGENGGTCISIYFPQADAPAAQAGTFAA